MRRRFHQGACRRSGGRNRGLRSNDLPQMAFAGAAPGWFQAGPWIARESVGIRWEHARARDGLALRGEPGYIGWSMRSRWIGSGLALAALLASSAARADRVALLPSR